MKTVVDNDSSSIISKVWSFCSTFTIKGKIWWELDEHRRSLHIERSEGVAARALCCSWLCLRRSAYEKVLQTMHQRILMNWSKKVSLVKWEQPAKVRTMNWNAKGSERAQRAQHAETAHKELKGLMGGKVLRQQRESKGTKRGQRGHDTIIGIGNIVVGIGGLVTVVGIGVGDIVITTIIITITTIVTW